MWRIAISDSYKLKAMVRPKKKMAPIETELEIPFSRFIDTNELRVGKKYLYTDKEIIDKCRIVKLFA